MTWTYEPELSAVDTDAGRVNAVRLLIGDTNQDDQRIQNEEIAFFLSVTGNDVYLAAAESADVISSKYTAEGNEKFEGISYDGAAVSENYRKLASRLRQQAKKFGSRGLGMPSAGGISRSQMGAVDENTDRVRPKFRQDQFANPSSEVDYEP
jgi:hypothetical protein